MSGFAEDTLTCDAFLGGKLHLYQPRKGYRAGIDPVLLAAVVRAEAGQSVLELGCGVGTASLCLGARVPGLRLTGVERARAYAALAARNGGADFEVIEADIAEMPQHLRARQFDHVLVNPPYYDRSASRPSADPAREAAHGAQTPLALWVAVAAKRLKPKGQAYFIHRVERLPDLLKAMPKSLGSVEALPIAARVGRVADRVIVTARKNGRADFVLHSALVVHQGATHESDGTRDFTPEIQAVLHGGHALEY